jgi:hypothetical protein
VLCQLLALTHTQPLGAARGPFQRCGALEEGGYDSEGDHAAVLEDGGLALASAEEVLPVCVRGSPWNPSQ